MKVFYGKSPSLGIRLGSSNFAECHTLNSHQIRTEDLVITDLHLPIEHTVKNYKKFV